MGSVNKVFLIGNLCAKPELKFLPSGQAVCELRLATNETWTGKDGIKQEKAEFHSIVVWGKIGENCAKYLDKGRQVCVEGRLQTRDWLDKETQAKRYKTEVVANQVTFLGSGKGRTEEFTTDPDTTSNGNGFVTQPTSTPASEDDIPF